MLIHPPALASDYKMCIQFGTYNIYEASLFSFKTIKMVSHKMNFMIEDKYTYSYIINIKMHDYLHMFVCILMTGVFVLS